MEVGNNYCLKLMQFPMLKCINGKNRPSELSLKQVFFKLSGMISNLTLLLKTFVKKGFEDHESY